jgi:hypothetical protein
MSQLWKCSLPHLRNLLCRLINAGSVIFEHPVRIKLSRKVFCYCCGSRIIRTVLTQAKFLALNWPWFVHSVFLQLIVWRPIPHYSFHPLLLSSEPFNITNLKNSVPSCDPSYILRILSPTILHSTVLLPSQSWMR